MSSCVLTPFPRRCGATTQPEHTAHLHVYRAPCGGGRGKEEPLGVIAMVLQAAPGNDGLPPPGPPRHTSAA